MMKPVRKIKPNRRSITGWAKCRNGNSVPFESALERDWIITLDFDLGNTSIHTQPFTVDYYNHEFRQRFYTPDILVLADDHSGCVYEVKYRDDLWQNWEYYRPKFKAAIHYCREEGLRFKIITEKEIRTPHLENATFLRRYREYPVDEAIEIELTRTLRDLFCDEDPCSPKQLLEYTYRYEPNQVKAIPHLWRLMDAHIIRFVPWEKLTMDSPIWISEDLL